MKFVAPLKTKQGILDFGSILLLLLAGYLFVSGSWQPLYWTFIPRQPVLFATDWEGSTLENMYEYLDPSYKNSAGTSYVVSLSRYYDKNRIVSADIKQVTTWFENTEDAKHAWENPQKEIDRLSSYESKHHFLPIDMDTADTSLLDKFYAKPLPLGISVPSSMFCYDYPDMGIHHTCMYFGYYEHWFTQIWFGDDKNYLDDKVMFQLIEKAVEIIRAAPAPK